MNRLLQTFLLGLCCSFNIGAAPQHFKSFSGKLSLSLAHGWQANENLLGLPLSFLGPVLEDKSRPVLTIVGSKEKTARPNFKTDALKISRNEFVEQKRLWLQKQQIQGVDFLPGEERKITDGSMIVLGHRYLRKGRRYTEMTYKIICGGQYFHAVALISATNESYLRDVDTMLGGMKCK